MTWKRTALIRGTKNANRMRPVSQAYANGVLMEGAVETTLPTKESPPFPNFSG
jgi:hypothetical protein